MPVRRLNSRRKNDVSSYPVAAAISSTGSSDDSSSRFASSSRRFLHVVEDRDARGGLEASLQRALGNPRMRNDARHGARFAEVLAQPRLAPAHDGISVRLLSDQRLVRQLALVVPL